MYLNSTSVICPRGGYNELFSTCLLEGESYGKVASYVTRLLTPFCRNLVKVSFGITFFRTEYSQRKRKQIIDASCEKLISRTEQKGKYKVHPLDFKISTPIPVKAKNHSHPELAAIRNTASIDIQRYCSLNSFTRYDHSTSNRESKYGPGNHGLYTMKDVITPYRNDDLPPGALVSFVDCDYYESSLNRYAGYDMCIFTFTPKQLAGSYHESVFRYTSTTSVQLLVDGYATYKHNTWDYRKELIALQSYGYSYIYRVDILNYSPQHSLVFLTHKATFINPFRITSWILGFDMDYLGVTTITETRTYLVRPVFDREKKNSSFKGFYQILRKGDPDQVQIPCTLWNQLVDKYYSCKIPAITTVDINSMWSHANGSIPDVESSTFSYIKTAIESRELDRLYLPPSGVSFNDKPRYEVVVQGNTVQDFLETEKNSTGMMKQISPALSIDSDVNVVPNMAAMDIAVQKRVVDVRNDCKPDKKYDAYTREFVGLLLRKRVGISMDPSDVILRQTKKAQKVRNERAKDHVNAKPRATFFLKADPTSNKTEEGVMNSSPVRIITQFNPEQCLALSKYAYSFKDQVLKHVHWYAPGWDPVKTNDNITIYLARNPKLPMLETDLSKMDGRISEYLRGVERAVYMGYFTREQAELGRLLDNDHHNLVKNYKAGVSYSSKFERASGSALTTDANTIISAYMFYSYHRNRGLRPKDAWRMIGPKAGDDSLDYGEFVDFQNTAQDLGMVVTGESIPRNMNRTVTFLSRTYQGSLSSSSSICDVGRALRKLHLSSNKIVDDITNFSNKVLGYGVTDPTTPIISNLVALAQRLAPGAIYDPNLDLERSYQTSKGPYPNSLTQEEMVAIISKQIGLPPDAIRVVAKRIDEAGSLDDLYNIIPETKTRISINTDLTAGLRDLTAISSTRKAKSNKTMKAKLIIKAKVNTSKNGKSTKQKNVYKTCPKSKTCDSPKTSLNGAEQSNGFDPASTREC